MVNHLVRRGSIDIALSAVDFQVAEDVNILVGNAIFKVDDFCRIDSLTQEAGFKMEMRAGRTPGIATQADRLSCLDYIIYLHQLLRQVAVNRFQPVRMPDDEIVAIAPALVVADADFPIESGTDRIAFQDF